MSIYFDDLHYNGRSEDFARDPHWDAAGNHADYHSKFVVGAHDFGYSRTSHAAGKAGEIGGTMWRAGQYAYYADRVGPLSLEDRLEARGKVVLKVGGPDSDIFLGWFSSASKETPPVDSGNFLGVHVGGPTRIGHYFQPSFTTAKGTKGHSEAGSVMSHGTVQDWSITYDPHANDATGAITVTLGDKSVTLPLKKGVKQQGAQFDRFGLLTPSSGGQMVTLYLDDIEYTAAPAR
jgi:hypothetical protein